MTHLNIWTVLVTMRTNQDYHVMSLKKQTVTGIIITTTTTIIIIISINRYNQHSVFAPSSMKKPTNEYTPSTNYGGGYKSAKTTTASKRLIVGACN